MRSRRKSREAALQALYQCDTLNEWTDEIVARYFEVFLPDSLKVASGTEQENVTFAKELIFGVSKHRAFIDAQIAAASTHWSVARMSRVDRNILRCAVYELAFLEEVPTNVSINEAIEIAKRFGSEDSPMFINGVLDRVSAELQAHPEVIPTAVEAF